MWAREQSEFDFKPRMKIIKISGDTRYAARNIAFGFFFFGFFFWFLFFFGGGVFFGGVIHFDRLHNQICLLSSYYSRETFKLFHIFKDISNFINHLKVVQMLLYFIFAKIP